MSKTTEQQFVVNVSEIPETWQTSDGFSSSSETTLDYNGGSPTPDILGSPATYEDIEISRTYDPILDQRWIKKFRPLQGRSRHTLTKFATDANYIPVGEPETWPCVLKGITLPKTDAASGDAGKVTLTFATTGPAQ